jgi:hypothetical protein
LLVYKTHCCCPCRLASTLSSVIAHEAGKTNLQG